MIIPLPPVRARLPDGQAVRPVRPLLPIVCFLLAFAQLSAQVVIREKVEVSSRYPNDVVQFTQTTSNILRMEIIHNGTVRSDLPAAMWLMSCGQRVDAPITGGSTSLSVPVGSGNAFYGYQYTIVGQDSLKWTERFYLDHELIEVRSGTTNCPSGCTRYAPPLPVPLSSSFELIPPPYLISIDHGEGTGAGTWGFRLGNFSAVPCSSVVWHPNVKTTIRVIHGAELGELYDGSGGLLGDEFVGTVSQINGIGFIANGLQPESTEGIVTLEASSRGIVRRVTFKVRETRRWLRFVEFKDIYFGETISRNVSAVDRWGREQTLPADVTFTIEILQGHQWGTLLGEEESGDTLRGLRHWNGSVGIWFEAWELEPSIPQTVVLRAVTSDPAIIADTTDFKVLPTPVTVVATPPVIAYGERSKLEIFERLSDGTLRPVEKGPDQYAYFYFKDEMNIGWLISADGSQKDLFSVDGEDSHAYFLAEEIEPQDDSVTVLIGVEANEGWGWGRVLVLKKAVVEFDRFLVIAERDTIEHEMTASLFIKAVDKEGKEVELPAGTMVNVVLRADEKYASIAYRGRKGLWLDNVPYEDARKGYVWFVADGENPIGLKPQKVDIGVTGAGKEGVRKVWVQGALDYTHFKQADSLWGDRKYDEYIDTIIVRPSGKRDTVYYKIRRKGCAVAGMAMVLKAFGVDANPGSLNKWMIENKGFDGSSVIWESIDRYLGNNKVEHDEIVGAGYKRSKINQLGKMDPYLSKGLPVLAEVFNPTTNGQHWVLVTGKRDGQYKILDPGGYANRNTLDGAYKNTVYRFIVYTPKR